LEETYIEPSKNSSKFKEEEKLIAKSDCIGCITKIKVVGPSTSISLINSCKDKNINYLSGQIIKGGSGVGKVPMGAHSSLNKDEAKSMVKYILSLKK
jgi:cytochrome c